MKKINLLFSSLVCLSLAMSSCSCNRRGQFAGENYPANPTQGQRYVDSNGNSSIWNAALGCWMISSMINGRSVQHNYYPSGGYYTDHSGQRVNRPATIPVASTPGSRVGTANTSSRSGVSTRSNTATPAKSAGFGATGRGSSSAS